MRSILFSLGLLLSMVWGASAFAEDNSCWVMAPAEQDVWAIIYDADADGNRNNVIWKGKIAAGQKVKIISTDGHIRYDSADDPNQPYGGDVSVGCYGEQTFIVD